MTHSNGCRVVPRSAEQQDHNENQSTLEREEAERYDSLMSVDCTETAQLVSAQTGSSATPLTSLPVDEPNSKSSPPRTASAATVPSKANASASPRTVGKKRVRPTLPRASNEPPDYHSQIVPVTRASATAPASTTNVVSDEVRTQIALRLAPLSQSLHDEAIAILATPPSNKVLTQKYSIIIRQETISRLRLGGNIDRDFWLNDSLINFYMGLLKDLDSERCLKDVTREPSHYYSTQFMDKLLDSENTKQYTYKAVCRWSKKFDIFALGRLYIPINITKTHWSHIMADMVNKKIEYWDSFGNSGRVYIEATKRYICDEARTKKGWINYDISEWTVVDHLRRVPQQANGG